MDSPLPPMPLPEPASPPPAAPGARSAWAKPIAWTAIVFILVAGGLFLLIWLANFTSRTVGQAGGVLTDLASAFRRGTITTSFFSYATSIHPTHFLQFATLKQTEVFTRKDEASTGFGYIPLPDVVVEARAPVDFTYYLDLNAPWQMIIEGNVLHVLAPPIRHNKPAVDASEIQYDIRKGSLIRDTASAEANLKKSISELAEQRARENVPLVKEIGRKQTAEFVEKWLMKSFSDGPRYTVKVYFPGEPAPVKRAVPVRRE